MDLSDDSEGAIAVSTLRNQQNCFAVGHMFEHQAAKSTLLPHGFRCWTRLNSCSSGSVWVCCFLCRLFHFMKSPKKVPKYYSIMSFVASLSGETFFLSITGEIMRETSVQIRDISISLYSRKEAAVIWGKWIAEIVQLFPSRSERGGVCRDARRSSGKLQASHKKRKWPRWKSYNPQLIKNMKRDRRDVTGAESKNLTSK